MRRPSRKTYGPNPQPVLLWKVVIVQLNDWWCTGTIHSTATMIATPTMCHQAEMLLRMATSETPNVFRRPWIAIRTTNTMNVTGRVGVMPQTSAANAIIVVAAP